MPAVGRGEETLAPAIGSREGALLVTEELGLEQRLGHRRAVHGHESPAAPRARPVDGLGHELLPRPALPQQEHRGIAFRHGADLTHRLLHDPRAAEQPIHSLLPLHLRAQPFVLAAQAMVVESAAHRHRHLGELEGLGEVVVGALAKSGDGRLQGAERRHENHARRGSAPGSHGQHLEASHLVHDEIGDHHVELLGGEGLQRFPASRGRGHRHAFALQMPREHGAHVGVVVDDEDAPRAHVSPSYRGSQTMKDEPSPRRLRASMAPP